MPDKVDNTVQKTDADQEIQFKCKFCGEIKPLSELVVLRHYYPQISACQSCSRKQKPET